MEWLETLWATYSTLALSVGTNILLALSIYLTLACGLLTVANAAFMGIGAYTAAILTLNAGAPFVPAILAGALLAAAAGLVIGRPTLRHSAAYRRSSRPLCGRSFAVCSPAPGAFAFRSRDSGDPPGRNRQRAARTQRARLQIVLLRGRRGPRRVGRRAQRALHFFYRPE